jgi:hypothetical protein
MKSRIKKSVEDKLKSKFNDRKNLSLQLLQKHVYIHIIPNRFVGINFIFNIHANIYPSDGE